MFKLTVTGLTSMPRSSFKFSIKEYILRLQEKMVKELGRVIFSLSLIRKKKIFLNNDIPIFQKIKFVSKCLYFSFLLQHYQLFFFIFLTCIIGEQTLTFSTHFCISSFLNPKPIKTPPTQNPKIQSLAPLFSHH